jgi:hypothetical protein
MPSQSLTDKFERVWALSGTVYATQGISLDPERELTDEQALERFHTMVPATWVEPVVGPTCGEIVEEIKNLRDHLSSTGGYKVVVDGVDKWFHSDAQSKTQQLSLVIMGAAAAGVPPWKTMDGSKVAMSPALAGQIFLAAVTQDGALFAAAEAHIAAVNASNAPEIYNYTAGWPVTFGAPRNLGNVPESSVLI